MCETDGVCAASILLEEDGDLEYEYRYTVMNKGIHQTTNISQKLSTI